MISSFFSITFYATAIAILIFLALIPFYSNAKKTLVKLTIQ